MAGKFRHPYRCDVDYELPFSTQFSQAIEAKVVAYQRFLQSQNQLKQVQVEAQQAIASARGDAEANRLRRQSITPLTVQYDAVQKWDGHLPSVTGGCDTDGELRRAHGLREVRRNSWNLVAVDVMSNEMGRNFLPSF